MKYAGTESHCTDEFLRNLQRRRILEKINQVSWIELQECAVGQTAIVMRKQSQRLINEQKIYPTAGIHFIDSGNYHYMTRLWLTRMDQPFCLLVYDNHTDMQPPAFGGIFVVWRMDRGSVGGTGESEICDPCGTG